VGESIGRGGAANSEKESKRLSTSLGGRLAERQRKKEEKKVAWHKRRKTKRGKAPGKL